MKIQVKVETTQTIHSIQEVELPLYLRDYDYYDGGGSHESFIALFEPHPDGLKGFSITVRRHGDVQPEYEFIADYICSRRHLGDYLRQWERTTSEPFEEVIAEAQAAILKALPQH